MMKKIVFAILLSLIFVSSVDAAMYTNKQSTYTNPDGSKITIYTTGDEYFRYSHDIHGNVLTLNKDGYYTYAVLIDGKVKSSNYKYNMIATPFKTIKVKDIDLTKNKDLIHTFEETEKKVKNKTYSSKKKAVWQTDGSSANVLSFKNLVVFLRFKGENEFIDSNYITEIEELLGKTNSDYSSVKSYVSKVSNGTVNMDNTLLQHDGQTYYSYNSDQPRGYYLAYSSSNTIGYTNEDEGYERLHKLMFNALNAMPTTEASNLDGDGDGYIDNITFITNGESSPNWADVLWPHKYSLDLSENSSFKITVNGVIPATYNLQFSSSLEVGVLTHETMHSLGMPDLYRYSYLGTAVGSWDMMTNNEEGTLVTHAVRQHNGFTSSDSISWTTNPITVTESGKYTLDLASTNSNRTSLKINTSYSSQYIQLEYRGNNNEDVFDSQVPYKGLLISRIDTDYIENGNRGVYGQNQLYDANYIDYNGYYIFREGEINDYYTTNGGNLGGAGDIENAAIEPCRTAECLNSFGFRDSTKTLADGAITTKNGTNTQIVIRNVTEVDNDTITVEVFTKNDNMYLNYSNYDGAVGKTFNLSPICIETCTDVSYSSADTSIATVDTNGNVTLINKGETTISVTASGTTKKCTISAANADIQNVKAELIDGTHIKVTGTITNTVDNIKLYRNDGYEEILVADNLTADAENNVSYIDHIGINNFGKKYTYYYVVVKEEIEIKSDETQEINTRDFLPAPVENIQAKMHQADKITLTFNKVDDADGYKVYVYNSIMGSAIHEEYITTTTYEYNVVFGKTYFFEVAAYKIVDEVKLEGEKCYDGAGISTKEYLLESPNNFAVTELEDNTIKISYDLVDEATSYIIYKSTDNKIFKKITTTETTYIDQDVKFGQTYYYKVSAVKENSYNGYKTKVKSVTVGNNIPTGLKVTNDTYTSLKLTWDKDEDAYAYEIYYSTSKTGTYKKLGSTRGNYYVHKKLSYGKYYYYKIRSYTSVNKKYYFSEFTNLVYKKVVTAAPVVSFTTINEKSVKLTWATIAKANSYRVYKSEDGTRFTSIGTTKNRYYTDNKVELNKKYYYRVVSYYGKTQGAYNTYEYTSVPASPTLTISGNKITIKPVTGVDGYELYKQVNNSDAELVNNLEGTTYEIEETNDLLRYYVRSYKTVEEEKIYSAPSNIVSNIAYLGANSFELHTYGAKGVTASVDGNENFTGYLLYVSTSSNGKYTYVTGKGSEVTNNSLIPGKTYYFKVRPYIILNGKKYYGKYSSVITYKHAIAGTPRASIKNKTYNSIELDWEAIPNVTGYTIYYNIDGGSYKKLTTTKATKYTHTKLTFGKKYTYKIQPYVTISKKNYYGRYFDVLGATAKLPTPSFTVANYGLGNIKVNIAKVSGATSYNIYVSKNKEKYETYNTTSTSYVLKDLDLDTIYYIYVTAVRNSIESDYEELEKEIKTNISPIQNFIIKQDTTDAATIHITWNALEGATGYVLYLEDNVVYKGTNTSYTDEFLKIGKKYTYSVVAYKETDTETYYSEKTIAEVTAKPYAITGTTITQNFTNKKLEFDFDYLDYVEGFILYRSTSATSGFTEIARNDVNHFEINNVPVGKTYYYRIVGYYTYKGQEELGQYMTPVKHTLTPDAVKNFTAAAYNYTTVRVKWDAVPSVNGYQVYYSTSKNGTYKLLKATTGTYYNHTKLTTGKTYYYKVRSYAKVGTKYVYSPFSEVKSAYAKPAAVQNVKVARYNYSSIRNKITWSKQSGATGYYIYHSVDGENFSYIGNTKKTYFIHKNAANLKTNYYKVVAYRTVGSKKYAGYHSNIVTMRVPIRPSVNYVALDKTYPNTRIMVFYFQNKGTLPLTILKTGRSYDNNYSSFNRNMYLIDSETAKRINSQIIEPYTGENVAFEFSSPTWYDYKTRLNFYILYDGIKYSVTISSYYGGRISEVE